MEIRIREVNAADYENLFDLFDEIDSLHRDNLPRRFKKANGPAREKGYFLGLIENENHGLFIAEMGEKLVGFAHVIINDAPPFPIVVPRRFAILDSIVVKASYQKHGVGKMLMDKMQAWAIDKGATSIELNVYEFNENAISFYEKLGYRTFSRKMSKEL
jgi:ribosomal protein S18 acetylase RimI-like enzyme